MRIVLVVCTLVACKGDKQSQPKQQPEAKPFAPDPACAAKAKALEPWLAQLQIESASHEIDFGSKLQVIDREPAPISHHIDYMVITANKIEAFDISQHDFAQSTLPEHATAKQLSDRLVKIRGQAAGPDERDAAPDDHLRIDVDVAASWGDVARAVEAATKAGY